MWLVCLNALNFLLLQIQTPNFTVYKLQGILLFSVWLLCSLASHSTSPSPPVFLTFPFVDVLVIIDKSTGENQRESNNKTNKLNYYGICVKMWITDYNISFRYSNHIVSVLYSVIHIHIARTRTIQVSWKFVLYFVKRWIDNKYLAHKTNRASIKSGLPYYQYCAVDQVTG